MDRAQLLPLGLLSVWHQLDLWMVLLIRDLLFWGVSLALEVNGALLVVLLWLWNRSAQRLLILLDLDHVLLGWLIHRVVLLDQYLEVQRGGRLFLVVE